MRLEVYLATLLFGLPHHISYQSIHRRRCSATFNGKSISKGEDWPQDDGYERQQAQDALNRVEHAFTVLARKNRSRTWKRLRQLVDMALSLDPRVRTVADIGTDHGLLAMGLAVSGRFDQVTGVDLSPKALESGALALIQEVKDYRQQKGLDMHLPLDIRCGDGVHVLGLGEGQALCIAGMGVHAMIDIVADTEHVKQIGCQYLLLQPTNARPRNLITLYNGLEDLGWTIQEECIEFLSSRWYFSLLFVRVDVPCNNQTLPGTLLSQELPISPNFVDYLHHHLKWLKQDQSVSELQGGEDVWMMHFDQLIDEL
jgi:tRNA A22 N-methylase